MAKQEVKNEPKKGPVSPSIRLSPRTKRKSLQAAAYELAMEARSSGDNESFVKLVTIFEKMHQADLRAKGTGTAAGKRTKIPAGELESRRERLQRELAKRRGS